MTRIVDKIVIFCSFQQKTEEIYDTSHFSECHFKYFDHVTFKKLKNAATNVFEKEKASALSELFSTELKCTVNVLVKWFNVAFKSRFDEVDEIKKQVYTRDNPNNWPNQKCVICDFKLAVNLNE